MGKSFSFDGILAALAVLSTSVLTTGCSKTESAAGAPETNVTAADKATAASSAGAIVPPTPSVASTAAIAPGKAADGPAAVDAGVERLDAPTLKTTGPSNKSGAAACGAQGCSPDMKKGTK